MLSPIKTKTTQFFTYVWILLFLSSQEIVFAGRSATEIAVTEWNPLSGAIVTPLRSTAVAEGLDIRLEALSLADASEPASSSTTSSITSISAPSSSSASPERTISVQRDRDPIIPGFRSFLDGLEVTARLSGHDYVLVDRLQRVILFHRVSLGKEPEFICNGPSKRSGVAQEFSRSWIADRLESIGQEDLLEQVIMDRYIDEDSSDEEESEIQTRQYTCIRTASSLIHQSDGPDQIKFYAVYDQLKPGRQEELVSPKLRPDGFYLKEWDQESSALVYLDHLAVRHAGHVVSFSNKQLFSVNLGGCMQRLERVFEFDPDSSYFIDFSHNSLDNRCVQSLGHTLTTPLFLERITEVNLDHNRFNIEGLKPFIPLLMQDSFRLLIATFNGITLDDIITLSSHIKSKFSKELSDQSEGDDTVIQHWLSKIIFWPKSYVITGGAALPDSIAAAHRTYYKMEF